MRSRGTLGPQGCCWWLRAPAKWGLQEEEPPNLISSDEEDSEPGDEGKRHGVTKQPDILQAVFTLRMVGGRAVQKRPLILLNEEVEVCGLTV